MTWLPDRRVTQLPQRRPQKKESRYQRLMRQVIREGVKTKVLMLSATPVNKRFNSPQNQLQLAYEGESGEPRPALESVYDG